MHYSVSFSALTLKIFPLLKLSHIPLPQLKRKKPAFEPVASSESLLKQSSQG
jgi:hypothetical protein